MTFENWLSRNDSRNYPLVDGTTRESDGRVMPTSLLVDAHVATPASNLGRVWFSSVRLTKPRVELAVSIEGVAEPVLVLDIQAPQAYRSYQLSPRVSGYHGFVCFGSGIATGLAAYTAEFDVEEAELLPSLVARSPSLPFVHASAGGDTLTGVVPVTGRDGVLVRFKTMWDPGVGQPVGALVIELEDRLEVLEAPLNECQIPLESGRLPEDELSPVLSVNGVYPDENGQVTIELDAHTFTYDDAGTEVEEPVIKVGASGAQSFLSFKSVIDLSEVCGATGRRVIEYATPRCVPCPDNFIQSGHISLGQAFIQRDYLVIEFLYNSTGSLIVGAEPDPVLDPVALSIDSTHSTQVGYGVRFVYDVNEDCEPVDVPGQEARPGRLVYRLNRVVRDTYAVVKLLATDGLMVESPVDVPPGYVPQRSPELDICLPIRDPFVYDDSFMDPATEAEINQEIQDYIDGNPPWEASSS